MTLSIDDQVRLLSRRCEQILNEDDLRRKLANSAKSSRPLRIKMGMDPTAPDVTLGHAVPMKVIRQFQDWGHKAVIIIGDVTGRVGDPSGVNATRPMLSAEQIAQNAQTYIQQVGKILLSDPTHLEVRYNGEWLAKMDIFDLIRLAARKTVAQMLQRDYFKERFTAGGDIHLHEFIYPLLQGWDSVVIDADVEMGGSDQLFNNLVGREFQAELGKEPQVVIVTPLLVGLDGAMKMSKSKGNYIGVTDPPSGPNGMFGKVMSLPDNAMEMYFRLLTEIDASDYQSLVRDKPRDAKVRLARTIISWLHDPAAAENAEREWDQIHKAGGIPEEMPTILLPPGFHRIGGVLKQANLVASSSEGHRKIKEGAIRIDGDKVLDDQAFFMVAGATPQHQVKPAQGTEIKLDVPRVMQLGNRRFVRVLPKS